MSEGILPSSPLAGFNPLRPEVPVLSTKTIGLVASTLLHGIIGGALFFSGALPTWTEEPPLRVSFVEFVPVGVESAMPAPQVTQSSLALKTAVTKSSSPKREERAEDISPISAMKTAKTPASEREQATSPTTPSSDARARLGTFEATAAGIDGAARTGPLKVGYESAVLARLERVKRYPSRALQRHLQGEVVLALKLNPDGTVISSAITRTSGYEFFDTEVLKMVERATPFPAAPTGLHVAALDFLVPVTFRLQ